MNNSVAGLTNDQITSGTPSQKKIILKAFYKDDKCTISPAKDFNGRYVGIQENIPEVEKLKMGYVPSIDSRVKIYDGMEIDLNDATWAKDWEWMKHCPEIAPNFKDGQETPGAYFYIFRPGYESAKKVDAEKRVLKLKQFILEDTPNNLYNRVKVLGTDMDDSVVSDVQEFLLNLVNTAPDMVENVYESRSFALELLFLDALRKNVIEKKGNSYVFGNVFLGVDKKSVIAFLGNVKNTPTVSAIEALTYGKKSVKKNPLEDEVVSTTDILDEDADLEEREKSANEAPKKLTATERAAVARAAKNKK
jgi:hypothetical protein